MKQNKYDGIFAKIAKSEGVSIDTIKEEIQKAILIGYNSPEHKQIWRTIPCKENEPTAEEVIDWIISQIK